MAGDEVDMVLLLAISFAVRQYWVHVEARTRGPATPWLGVCILLMMRPTSFSVYVVLQYLMCRLHLRFAFARWRRDGGAGRKLRPSSASLVKYEGLLRVSDEVAGGDQVGGDQRYFCVSKNIWTGQFIPVI